MKIQLVRWEGEHQIGWVHVPESLPRPERWSRWWPERPFLVQRSHPVHCMLIPVDRLAVGPKKRAARELLRDLARPVGMQGQVVRWNWL